MFLAKKLNRGAGTPAAPADAQFNYVTMLLHGDGTNGAQNNTFLDSSSNTFTITRNGNTTQGSFSPYGSNWSNYFNGSGYLSLTSNSSLNFGTGDFTIECWLNISSLNGGVLIDFRPSSTNGDYPLIYQTGSGFEFYASGGTQISSGAITIGTWFHFALCRSGSSMKMFFNGTQTGSTYTASVNYSVGSILGIATSSFALSSSVLDGYISNLRVLKGTALYTTTFTPPTTPLTAITNTSLLTCQSNRFIDNSTNVFAITATNSPSVQRFNPFGASTAYSTSVIGGSGYFDGSGDFLSSSATTGLSTSDYTMEMWVYPNSFSASYVPFSYGWSTTTTPRQIVFVQQTNATYRIYYDDASVSFTSTNTVNLNAWNHLALVRNGNTFSFYINGVLGATSSNTITYGVSSFPITIGSSWNSSTSTGDFYYPGYISDFRISIGTAVYTSAFTPPTAPLTASTTPLLLLNMTNGAIFDNAMMNDLETVGNAQISTSVVKYGTGSIKCTGDGNTTTTNSGYLLPNSLNSNLSAFGTGNFTIEFWLYLNSTSGLRILLDFRGSTETAFPVLYVSGGTLSYYVESDRITGSSLSTSTWYHIALCRSSGSTKLFVNGTQSGSTFTDSINYANASTRTPVIGANSYTGGGNTLGWYALDGNIDDLRITKGYARYTANFSVPTAAFPNTGPV